MTKTTKDIFTDLLVEMTGMVDDIKKRKEKHKKDIKESTDFAINWLKENKGDIDSLIILAVKDQDVDKNDKKDGLNVISGREPDLLNLIANIDEDLMNDFISIKVKEKFK